MEEWIVNTIINMITNVTSVGSDLIKTPEEFNATIYTGILNIQKNIITPIALVILAIFLLLELQSITTRTDTMGERGFEIPFKIMIKFIICKTALDMTPLILSAIFNVSKVLIMINVVIINTISFISNILITAIIYGRMIEMYVFIGIAPLPMATIPNAEQSSIAKNFLKSFTAVSIQGVLMCISIAIMGILFSGIVTIDPSNIDSTNLLSLLWECTGYSIITVFALLSSGKWAKSICNAM